MLDVWEAAKMFLFNCCANIKEGGGVEVVPLRKKTSTTLFLMSAKVPTAINITVIKKNSCGFPFDKEIPNENTLFRIYIFLILYYERY